MYTDALITHFWSLVEHEAGDDACWTWRGRSLSTGMGFFSIPGISSGRPAHRVAYDLTFGQPSPGHLVWRTCRNAECVNPHHLHAGDRAAFTQFLRHG